MASPFMSLGMKKMMQAGLMGHEEIKNLNLIHSQVLMTAMLLKSCTLSSDMGSVK